MAKFSQVPFDGDFLASFGRPELRGSWIIYGGSGSGKTTLALMLCKYLTRFRKVAYDSLEQGLSLSMQKAWKRVGMEEAGASIVFLNKESVRDLTLRLAQRRSPGVVVIDSVHYLFRFGMTDYMRLKSTFPEKLFIWVAHEENGQPKGKMAQNIRFDSDVKVRVEGYKAFVTTRYEDPGKGEGGADFIIWDKGAKAYWIEKLM